MKKRKRKTKAKAAPEATVTVAPVTEVREIPEFIQGQAGLMPHPDSLLMEAEQEPNYRDLAEYTSVIGKLREKGFTFRDIAEWLTERGVEADHNAVYRVYAKNMSDLEAMQEAQRDEDEEREEAMRNR